VSLAQDATLQGFLCCLFYCTKTPGEMRKLFAQYPKAKNREQKKIEISLSPFGKNNPAESERVGVGGVEKCMQCNSPVQVLHASDVSPASE